MDTEKISEPIDVGAVFGKNKIKPKWFVWQNRKYDIKEVTCAWKAREGEAVVQYFAVTNGATSFEISLNQKTMSWRLEKTILD
jgi:hypothetical protein